jgi:hypothetical protein
LLGVRIPIEFGLGFTTDPKFSSRSTEDQIKIIDKLVALTKRFLVSNEGLADVVNKYAILKPVIAKRIRKFIVTFDPTDSIRSSDKYAVKYEKGIFTVLVNLSAHNETSFADFSDKFDFALDTIVFKVIEKTKSKITGYSSNKLSI